MTQPALLMRGGADFVRPASEIRDQIYFIENRMAHLVYPETFDDSSPASVELAGELTGLYFALGERRPLFSPVYLFDYKRKKHQAKQKEKETQHDSEDSANTNHSGYRRELETSGATRSPVPLAKPGSRPLAAKPPLPVQGSTYRPAGGASQDQPLA